MEKKMNVPVEQLCKCLPIQITSFLNYIHSLQFEDKPDYRFLRKILRELFFL
jgi:casein kinase 1